MLEHSVAAFAAHERVDDVIVVLPAELADARRAVPDARDLGRRSRSSPAEQRRQDSVANAFDRVSRCADVVLVHDAARPFVSADLIARAIDAAAAHGAAIAALPARDTVKRVVEAGEHARDRRDDSARRRSTWRRRRRRFAATCCARPWRSGARASRHRRSDARRARRPSRPRRRGRSGEREDHDRERPRARARRAAAAAGQRRGRHRLRSASAGRGPAAVLGGVTIPSEQGRRSAIPTPTSSATR